MQGNILVLTGWSFKDALVQAYTLPYVHIMRNQLPSQYKIILVTSEQANLALSAHEVNIINDQWATGGMRLVALPYKKFGLKKVLATGNELSTLYRLIKKEKITILHAFCTPAGSLAYLLSKLTGAKLIIDSYEPHAAAMVENNTWKPDSMPFKILSAAEKLQTKRARYLIGTTATMKEYAVENMGAEGKVFFTKPACVDFAFFYPRERNVHLLDELGLRNTIVCVYAGKLGGIYLKEEVFDFIKACTDFWGDRFRFLMLSNASDEEIENQCERAGILRTVVIKKFVSHHDVPQYLSLGDFGINPVKPVPTKRFCTSMKDGEYWAMGLPVVITKDISDDSDIIQHNEIGYVLQELTPAEYSRAVTFLDSLLQQDRTTVQQKIFGIAKQHRDFSIARDIYHTIYG